MAAAPTPFTPVIPIKFSRQLPMRRGADGIDIKGSVDTRLAAALRDPAAPFPPGEYPLATVEIAARAAQDIVFESGRSSVVFSAHADAGLGIYRDPAHLLAEAGIQQYFGDSIILSSAPPNNPCYVLLMWGYAADASTKGAVALGVPAVSFGTEGDMGKKYAVIRRFPQDAPASASLVQTLDSWTLPSLVKTSADLSRDTWLFTETDGHFQASLSTTYGYDFNWVREAKLGGLGGDIGLKIQLGIEAALGLDVSSAFAIVLSREGENVLRVRVFKQPKKGWQFAFDAAAKITPVAPETPAKLDDFILSILDLHSQQLLKDLSDLKGWISGQAPLTGALAGVASRYMEQMLQTVYAAATGRPFDFEQAKAQVLQFLKTWDGLDARVASLLWKNVPDAQVLGKLAGLTREVLNCQNASDYAACLDKYVSQPPFLSGPMGQWLESLALGQILQPLSDNNSLQKLRNDAATAGNFLQAGTSESAMLAALHKWITSRIQLQAIAKVADSLTLSQLDGWIKAKLQNFLDQTFLGLSDVQKVQELIRSLYSKSNSFYEHARKALTDTYSLSFSQLYQSSSTSTALLDVEFDFGDQNANAAMLQKLFAATMSGDFTGILNTAEPGVTFHRALLSHGLLRHYHVEVRFPFYYSSFDEICRSLATVEPVGSENGRVLVYQLDASDDICSISNRNGSFSHLALAASLPSALNARKHGSPSFSYDYIYRSFSADMRRSQLQWQLGPYVDAYLADAFAGTQVSYETWLSDLDRAVDRQATDHYGHTLVALQLSLKSAAVAQWLNAPADSRSQTYMKMSLDLQRSGLKMLLPFYYFADVAKYKDLGAASPLIVFSCIPVSVSVDSSTLQSNFRDVYWDYADPELRRKMILREGTREVLRNMLHAISRRLSVAGMRRDSDFYAPTDGVINSMLSSVCDDPRLLGLLQAESQMVSGARAAGLAMAKFRNARDPQAAIRAFAAWGADVTRTFNGVCSVYGGNALRPLGTMMFATASASLGGPAFAPAALLRVAVLNPGITFDDSQFLQGTWPDQEELAIQQAIASA